jgi:hypothetical protein
MKIPWGKTLKNMSSDIFFATSAVAKVSSLNGATF